jgi:hypothetical protein
VRRAIDFLPLVMIVTAVASAPSRAENRIDVVRADAPALAAYGGQATGVRTLEFVNPDQVDIKNIDPKSPEPAALPLPQPDRQGPAVRESEDRGMTATSASG